MVRLIDADALAKFIDYGHLNNPNDKLYSENDIREMIDMMPTIEAVPLDGSFLKLSKDGYVIFQREWLYDHLEQEFDILRRASGRPTVEAIPVDQIRKDIERRRAKGQHLLAEAMEAILQIWTENQ